ncbi:MAG: divalent cation tolerance protein CutA [Hyphomicrobiales bacterium]
MAARKSANRRKARPPRAALVLSAYPSAAAASRAARALVTARVMACATVAPGARATFRWEGHLRRERSAILWGKTTAAKAAAAVRAIRASHPDRVPEILVIPVVGGHAPYFAWLAAETGGKR